MTPSLANIMLDAWRIARRGARRHGGSVRSYLRLALRLAWRRARRISFVRRTCDYVLTLTRRVATFIFPTRHTRKHHMRHTYTRRIRRTRCETETLALAWLVWFAVAVLIAAPIAGYLAR